MKTAFINLPYKKKIVRRYSCIYYASNFLFPPMELMSLASIVKNWKKDDAIIIDAIAEDINLEQVADKASLYKPDVLVFLIGIETFSSDLSSVEFIKDKIPGACVICFGYLPTIFAEDVLNNVLYIDYILLGEPDLPFSDVYDGLKYKKDMSIIKGIAFKHNNQIHISSEENSVSDIDSLPYPSRDLIDNSKYFEFHSNRPFATIQASRGCSYKCNYCIRTYGRKIMTRSCKSIINEIKYLTDKYGVKAVRFIDDNFCLDRKHTSEICRSIIANNINIKWSCLSRVDSVDKELLLLMKQAGCFRIYFGIETFSNRILSYYKKFYSREDILKTISNVKKHQIETVGFFMVGGIQTREEFDEDLKMAKVTGLDYLGVAKIMSYPGTEYFDEMKDKIDFSLFPYRNVLLNKNKEEEISRWEKEFYMKFYLRPRFIFKTIRNLFLYPMDTFIGFKDLITFVSGKTSVNNYTRDDFI